MFQESNAAHLYVGVLRYNYQIKTFQRLFQKETFLNAAKSRVTSYF